MTPHSAKVNNSLLPEHHVNSSKQEGKTHKVFHLQMFFKHQHGKDAEHNECNHFLDHLELECSESAEITDSVSGHHQHVFKQRNKPTEDDCFPQRPAGILQVIIPRLSS